MSLDLLRAARSARFHRGGRVEELLNDGGDLARVLDNGGTTALLALLAPEVDEVELDDGQVAVTVTRAGGGRARIRTRWPGGESADQTLPLLEVAPLVDVGPVLLDPSRPLHLRGGQWYAGVPEGPSELQIPAIQPAQLGSAAFREVHGIRYAYVAGAMAGGIGSPAIVEAMGEAGYLGFYGAGGLPLEQVQADTARIMGRMRDTPAGFNLLHNPAEPAVEEATVDAYLEHGVRHVDASAYMSLTSAVVRYRLAGIREQEGRIVVPNHLAAKVSRPEVAEQFLRPAPPKILEELVRAGALTARQAELARRVPVAEDVTAEADSGGHTDRRPLPVLVPILRRLVDRIRAEEGYPHRPRVGAAGGLGDPWSVAGALQLGADYVMTGSVNQATVEAGTSDLVKEMLAQAGYADVAMGPAPDMFEIGAEVQVLGRGSMYAQRATRLYELYRAFPSLEAIPRADREKVEKQIFGRPLAEVWATTADYWRARDVREVERAEADPHHKMALTFRWYLGMTSRWARTGEAGRRRDFQVWCGPAMGLFNDWVRGTWLEPLPARTVVGVANALMHGACVALRVGAARAAGIDLPDAAMRIVPHRPHG